MAEGVVQVKTTNRALVVASQARTRFVALPAGRRRKLTAVAIGLAALVLGFAWYAGRPDWRVLFTGLDGKDVAQVSQELAAAGISFQATPDGAGVEVPAELLDKARMEVAAKGMPQTGRLGFELFDKPNWVGSEFDERVNYQRALEGELEHTIATLGVVKSARVHLVLPQQSLFAAEEKTAKASVVLKLRRSTLEREQAESIRNLVASAVENLNPEQVTLVDADGRANLDGRSVGAQQGEMEQAMEAKLIAMLEPVAGAGNVRATVNVAYDQGSEERTDEIYDPSQSAAMTSEKTEQTSGAPARVAQGVPGTASNTPAAAVAGAVQGSAAAAAPGTPPLLEKQTLPVYPQAAASAGQTTKQESGTFAVSKHLVHTEEGPGRVQRVTAAVVVNDRMSVLTDTKGEHTAWKPRTAEEMHRLEGLAQAAVGYSEKRGDQVVIENVGFTSNVAEAKTAGAAKVWEQASQALAQQPGAVRTGVIGVLGLLVVLLVLKPVAGQVVATLREPAMLGAGEQGELTESRSLTAESIEVQQAAGLAAEISSSEGVPRDLIEKPRTSEEVFARVQTQIRREPIEGTRLLESWINAREDGD